MVGMHSACQRDSNQQVIVTNFTTGIADDLATVKEAGRLRFTNRINAWRQRSEGVVATRDRSWFGQSRRRHHRSIRSERQESACRRVRTAGSDRILAKLDPLIDDGPISQKL